MYGDFTARAEWHEDRLVVDGYVFRLEQSSGPEWELGTECFTLYKTKPLVDQYERFFAGRDLRPSALLELGMWEFGSLAFWGMALEPDRHVGVDILAERASDYFERYRASIGPDRLKTYWGVDQSDASMLRGIVARDFGGRLDVVIDDASHKYLPTKASFETLFPLMEPGGLYVIEDWAWEHWKDAQRRDHPRASDRGLTALIRELTELVGSAPHVAASLTVHQGFAVVERGGAHLDERFRIADHVVHRPAPRSRPSRAARRATARIRRAFSRPSPATA